MANNKVFPASAKITIIGGGPAGAATALSLARRGLAALILEASPTVKPKIGETLPPNCKPVLHQLGIENQVDNVAHLPSFGNKFIWGTENPREKHFLFERFGSGWQIRRQHFEEQLLEVVQQREGTVVPGAKLRNIQKQADDRWVLDVEVDGNSHTLISDFVVDASGRSAKFSRLLGCRRETLDALVGLSCRIPIQDGAKIPHFTHVEAVETGWWYAALLSSNEIVVVFLTDADLVDKKMLHWPGFWAALNKTRLLSPLFESINTVDLELKIISRSASTSCLEQAFGVNWLAVGDAAFAYDPISSYGISSALGGGFYAGQAIADHFLGKPEALPAYRKITEQAFLQYLKFWKQQYGVEKRWPESPFWQRRHRLFQ